MEKYAISSDNIKIHYQETGENSLVIVFVHGWLGNLNWWSSQLNYFKNRYTVVQIDLGGHGMSGKARTNWTSRQYVDDIKAVTDQLTSKEIVLVGHSMSGAFVLEASLRIPNAKAIVLVDTLKDLNQTLTHEQAEELLYRHYRANFRLAIEHIMPQYLFVDTTPLTVIRQLQNEFLQNSSELAINALEPLYKMDIKHIAKAVKIPVRAINSDGKPTNIEENRKYLKDYEVILIEGTGHYPMLEKPDEFNKLLDDMIAKLDKDVH